MSSQGIKTEYEQPGSENFESLFKHYYPGLIVYAGHMVQNRAAAEDIVQDVFFRLWQNIGRQHIVSVKTYLFNSVRNRCLNYLEHLKVRSEYQQKALDKKDPPGSLTWDNFVESELADLIENAIAKLPPQRQRIFRMSRFEFKTTAQIAQQLQLSPRTVERHMELALQDLRRELSHYLPAVLVAAILTF